jgi:NAD(P)H-flavin reductase
MGPTGMPTEIAGAENVLLVGGGLGNAVLFSIGKAFREMGSKVLYVAGYRKKSDRYKIKEIEDAADHIVWSCEEAELKLTREEDFSFKGNIIAAIESYNKSFQPIKLSEVNRIIAIGSDGMMNAIQMARKSSLKEILNNTHKAIASINSPMQCMMKEICGQCIQKHLDPETGLESFVYSCNNQDQNMDLVDFTNLKDRLSQNSLPEKLSDLFDRRLGNI